MPESKELQVAEKKAVGPAQGEALNEGPMFAPQVDIMEDAEAITVRADVPGATRESIGVNVEDGVLTLVATVPPVAEHWRALYREYNVGGWTRRFTLGEQVDPGKITAKLDHGVLTLTLAKAEAHKPRKVVIQ